MAFLIQIDLLCCCDRAQDLYRMSQQYFYHRSFADGFRFCKSKICVEAIHVDPSLPRPPPCFCAEVGYDAGARLWPCTGVVTFGADAR